MTKLPPAPIGHTWIDIDRFCHKYLGVIPSDLFIELQKASMKGATKVAITTSTIFELEELLADRKAKDKKLALCARLNNKGIAYEKDGNIRQAIKTYEKNIESNYPAHHSFKRLMVLYRRNKDYVNEIRVIERALAIFPNEREYEQRLDKAIELHNKQL